MSAGYTAMPLSPAASTLYVHSTVHCVNLFSISYCLPSGFANKMECNGIKKKLMHYSNKNSV